MSISCLITDPAPPSPHSAPAGHPDHRGPPEAGEAAGALGDDPRLPGLRVHGHVLFPGGARQPCGPGVQVPAVPPGAGRAAACATDPLGAAGGRLPRDAGQTSPDRHGVRFCNGAAALQPDGECVAVLRHLPDSHLHWHLKLEPLQLVSGLSS